MALVDEFAQYIQAPWPPDRLPVLADELRAVFPYCQVEVVQVRGAVQKIIIQAEVRAKEGP